MSWEEIFSRNEAQLEDFWGRRQNRPVVQREFRIFGHKVVLTTNLPAMLAAVDFVQPLYSNAPENDQPSFSIQLIVRTGLPDPGPLPENLFDHIDYQGYGQWLDMQLGRWGRCHVDLGTGKAVALLDQQLGHQPALVARYLLNTILTNFFIAGGYGFLHATALVKNKRMLLLMAPHNSGKSTTALRLVLAGYILLSDSMVFIRGDGSEQELLGFPVGRLKLRKDMVAAFPQVASLLESEPIRGELKYSADLRQLDPNLVQESVVMPEDICLCLLTRSGLPESTVQAATQEEVKASVFFNSLFFDDKTVWEQNLSRIRQLVERSRCFHFLAGTDPEGILMAADGLWVG